MRVEKECLCCGALYSIQFEQVLSDLDPDLADDTQDLDEDLEFYPEFCPFCGSHESNEEGDELDV